MFDGSALVSIVIDDGRIDSAIQTTRVVECNYLDIILERAAVHARQRKEIERAAVNQKRRFDCRIRTWLQHPTAPLRGTTRGLDVIEADESFARHSMGRLDDKIEIATPLEVSLQPRGLRLRRRRAPIEVFAVTAAEIDDEGRVGLGHRPKPVHISVDVDIMPQDVSAAPP